MAAHRIGELRIAVRADPDCAPTEREVRSYATRVWEAVGETLERRYPGRVYRVRAWESRWRLTRDGLRDAPAQALVGELVGFCERVGPTPPGAPPDAAADVVCFGDEPERVAGWWLARVAGGPSHWAWADLDQAPSVAAVLEALGATTAGAALERLDVADRSGTARSLLAVHDRSVTADPAALQRGDGARAVRGGPDDPGASSPARDWPPHEPDAAEMPPAGARHDGPAGAAADAATHNGAPRRTYEAVSPAADGVRETPPRSGLSDARDRAPEHAQPPAGAGTARPDDARAPAARTAWGGLVHLVGPMLECRVAEALWEACVDEQAVLHRGLAAVCGDAGDPAVATLSGTADARPSPVDAERGLEIRTRLVPALRRAAARRGLTRWPELALTVTSRGPAVLHATTLPWAIAAWPDAEGAGDEASAHAGVAALPSGDGGAWLPDAPETEEAALLAMVIGVPATLLALRLGTRERDPVLFARRWLRRAAWIADDGKTVTVRFGANAVDLDLRRSGADADPGWVPWLRRTVELHYDAPEVH